MELQTILVRQLLLLRQSIVVIDGSERFQHVPELIRKAGGNFHKLPSSVSIAVGRFALIRFPVGRSRLRRTEQGLSGCADALSLRAAALYTVPAGRIGSRIIPVRSRLHLQGTGSPREKIQLNWRNRWWI